MRSLSAAPRAAMKLMIALSLLLTLADCWQGERVRPSWVEGTSPEFPPSRYLVGVGQADTRSGAEEQAYAAVSKIFNVEVEAQSKDWESYLIVEGRSHTATERRLALEKVTRVSTDKVLENVRILDAWFDPKNRQYYALAGMDKTQAEAAFTERIRELDDTVAAQLNEANRTPDKLSRARNLKRAARNLVVREAYNADLRVIRANGQGNQAGYRVADLMNELEQFLAGNLAVSVDFDGDQAEPARRALIEGLTREGLSVGRSSAPTNDGVYEDGLKPELLVTGTVRVWPLDVRDPQFKYVRWCSDAVIEEIPTKRMIGAISKGGKEGHLTEREAVAKAVRVMQQEFSSELAHSIAGYVYGDMELPPASGTPPGCPRDERLERSGVPHQ
ncbi:MAG: LPP20 family lipoprotein [Nitrospira sp.]